MTSPAVPVSVFAAAAAAQERWVEAQAEQLMCLSQADRGIVTTQLKSAGTRTGLDWTGRFAAQISRFMLWSGLVFAGVIGAALWATRIPSRHTAAATTAAAYLVIVVVAVPVCRRQARPILNHLNRISAEAPRNFLTLYIPALAIVAILYSIVNATAFNAAAFSFFYVREFAAFIVVTALGVVLAYLLLAYAYASALQKPLASQTLSWAGTLASTAVTAWFPAARRSPAPAGNPHLDSGLLHLLGCTVTIDRMGRGQVLASTRTVRSIILSLEVAATDLEQYAVDRVPRFDTVTRRLARHDGARLASVIRNAKAPVARAVDPCNYRTVAATLTDFLSAWTHTETDHLTVVTDGDVSTGEAPLWRRIIGRIWNAVLLAAAAVALPLLPIYNSDPAAAAGLRYALLTAAVLALAAQGSPVSGVIQSAFEKTLPGGAAK